MFFTYLRRELAGRRRQTAIIAIGMALAIALVMIVNAVSTGVRDAQAAVLESVYGVGTDLTVSQAPAAPGEGEGPGGGVRFEFGQDDGATAEDGTTHCTRTTDDVVEVHDLRGDRWVSSTLSGWTPDDYAAVVASHAFFGG